MSEGRSTTQTALRANQRTPPMIRELTTLSSEVAIAFEECLEGFIDSLKPRNAAERSLVERAARASVLLDQNFAMQTSRLNAIIEDEPRREIEEADRLIERLFACDSGFFQTRGRGGAQVGKRRASRRRIAVDFDDPGKLVRDLENTVAGCERMLQEWRGLQAMLEKKTAWQPEQKLRAIHLLGRRLIDVMSDRDVLTILLGSWSINPVRATAFFELESELGPERVWYFRKALKRAWGHTLNAPDHESWRRMLVSIVEGAIKRVTAKLDAAKERAERDAALRIDCLSFDFSAEGERLRRLESSIRRDFFRTLDEFYKLRRIAAASAGSSSAVGTETGERNRRAAPEDPQANADDLTGKSDPPTPTTEGTEQANELRLAG